MNQGSLSGKQGLVIEAESGDGISINTARGALHGYDRSGVGDVGDTGDGWDGEDDCGDDDDGGGGIGGGRIAPTVGAPDAEYRMGRDDALVAQVTETANPGSEVTVAIGGQSVAVIADADRSREAVFNGAELPSNGISEDVAVSVADPDGTVTAVDWPRVLIDTTPPQVDTREGTVSAGGLFNAVAHSCGVTVAGTSEASATLDIAVGAPATGEYDLHVIASTVDAAGNPSDADGTSAVDAVAADGIWTAAFASAQLSSGEQTVAKSAVATDPAGNTETISQSVQSDTEAGLLAIDPDPVETDDVVNHDEAAADVVIAATDAAGNIAGSDLVTDDPARSDVTFTADLSAALAPFQVETIDLQFAEDSHLTLTEADILALSETTDTRTVPGGAGFRAVRMAWRAGRRRPDPRAGRPARGGGESGQYPPDAGQRGRRRRQL